MRECIRQQGSDDRAVVLGVKADSPYTSTCPTAVLVILLKCRESEEKVSREELRLRKTRIEEVYMLPVV